jgi:hypothetical protein
LAALLGAAALSGAASAKDVYKWVDSRGVINYSDEAPQEADAKRLNVSVNRFFVVPMQKPAPDTARDQAAVRQPFVSVDPRQGAASSAAAYEATREVDLRAWRQQMEAWRVQCINEKWADCDDPRTLVTRYGSWTWAAPYGPIAGPIPPAVGRPVIGVPATVVQPPAPPAEPRAQVAPMPTRPAPDPAAKVRGINR